jgi:hydroxypyruvate isomerase
MMSTQPPIESTSPHTTDHDQAIASRREGLSRRGWLAAAGSVAAASAARGALSAGQASAADDSNNPGWKVTQRRINQSVVQWCFNPMPIEELAAAAARLGAKSVELVDPKDWPTLKKHGLICAITMSHGFVRGLNHKEYHPECIEALTKAIDATSAAGWPNVITFSGMREKLTDEEGIANTVAGLKQVLGLAEKKKVNICLEPLNTRVHIEMRGHPGYQCDKLEWAVAVCDRIGSPRMKILFDIYHTQVMQGDVIVRLRQYKDYIAHYHTAGVPGRGDLDDTQEINYPAIMQAIIDTGYKGYVGQEFIPKGADKVAALRQAMQLCDV